MSAQSLTIEEELRLILPSHRIFQSQDFTVLKFLGEGGYGKVFEAISTDGHRVALKFFGYTKYKPRVKSIYKEIALMHRLDDGN